MRFLFGSIVKRLVRLGRGSYCGEGRGSVKTLTRPDCLIRAAGWEMRPVHCSASSGRDDTPNAAAVI